MAKKRVQYLDIVKAVSIFLIVFVHFVLLSETIPANFCMMACLAGVPMFFMVNGALLFSRPLDLGKHIKKTLMVYLVLVVWRLFYLPIVGPACQVEVLSFGKGRLLAYLFAFGNLEGFQIGHLWFMEALLAVYVVFPLFRVAFDRDGGDGLLLFFAVYALTMTNGMTGLRVALDALAGAGIAAGLDTAGLEVLNPFGMYANMLGFFLLGAWIHLSWAGGRNRKKWRLPGLAAGLLGLTGMWAVKWYTSGSPAWDGSYLDQGYRHIPVIFMAVGFFLFFRSLTIRNPFAARLVEAVASRTLGIYYLHWIFGWLFVPRLALVFSGYNVGTNILRTFAQLIPAFALTLLLERIPVVRHLVTG